MSDPRRRIPSVERLLSSAAFAPLLAERPRPLVADALQAVQAEVRRVAVESAPAWLEDAQEYATRVALRLRATDRPSLRRVINATGVVLHTNLGRAPLADAALAAIAEAGRGYTNLEYDLAHGGRGSRYSHCVGLLVELTGAEDALVVNNNAAALLLALNALAADREVPVSRGELVEIGGGFRIHDIAASSGARLREVGSTNRTHLSDYQRVLGPHTGALLKVHRSNFRMEGFVGEVDAADLAALAEAHRIPLIHDLGSGLLLPLPGIAEVTAADAVRAGAALVTMSGDKLLGGPQAGIIVGSHERIAPLRANPLTRALRVDRLTLSALEATLRLYRDPARARREIPTLRALSASPEELLARAERIGARLRLAGFDAQVWPATVPAGGGAAPDAALPGSVVALSHGGCTVEALEERLRSGEPPVVARIARGRLLLDPRTVAPDEEAALLEAVARAAGGGGTD
jgi:L-seryl-tRNA(Ser) seleniumtransferase